MRFILASASPRRQELLRQIGARFEVSPSGAAEFEQAASPAELVMKNASRKAQAVARLYEDDFVLGADTAVVLDGTIFGKPSDAADAERILGQLAGREHAVLTGIAIARGTRLWYDYERTAVRMARLSPQEIASYVSTGEPMDKAGAYAIQGKGAVFIEGITGCYGNVVGLPLRKLFLLCRKAGLSLS